MNRFEDPRYVGTIFMLVLSFAGVALVWLNSLSKNSPIKRDLMINRMLWKFELISMREVFLSEQRIAFYKIVVAGIMANSVLIALLLKIMSVSDALKLGGLFFVVWFVVLIVMWKWYVGSLAVDQNVSQQPELNEVASSNFQYGRNSDRLRVTIVTGFLGSGKTTLIKRILNNTAGMKILVIENEIGSEGIDHELLLQATQKEDIVLLNNGCICCTVRNDLLSTLRQLFKSEAFSRLDWIIIETTGLADPAPIIQSFYMDKECQEKMVVDGVLTVVDARHISLHLQNKDQLGAHGRLPEAILQISYADRILLNKIDLVSSTDLLILRQSISEINSTASIFECIKAEVNIQELLNIQAFDPSKFSSLNYVNSSTASIFISTDGEKRISKEKSFLNLKSTASNTSISTVSLVTEEPLDLKKFNVWISELIQTRGLDIFRMKGILAMNHFNEKFIFHCIHMVFDGFKANPWNKERKISKLVVIGRHLNKNELEQGFYGTIAT